jgi:hypothetical protein
VVVKDTIQEDPLGKKWFPNPGYERIPKAYLEKWFPNPGSLKAHGSKA